MAGRGGRRPSNRAFLEGPPGRRPSNRAPSGPPGPPGRRMCSWTVFDISMNSSLLSLPSLSLSNFSNILAGFGGCGRRRPSGPRAPARSPLPALPPTRAARMSRIFSRASARSSSSSFPFLFASNSLSMRSRISARLLSPFLPSFSGGWAIAERASALAATNAKHETRYRIPVPFENKWKR